MRVTGTLGDEVLALDTPDEKLLWELDVQVLAFMKQIKLLEEANKIAVRCRRYRHPAAAAVANASTCTSLHAR